MAVTLPLLAMVVIALLTIRIVPADIHVVDGDTVRRKGVDWRITGYDAPEWDQPGGRAATAQLARILRAGRSVAIVRSRDAYGRPLATILTTRGPLSWRMALSGHAHGTGVVAATLTLVARLLGRGLWGMPGAKLPPRQWRDGVRHQGAIQRAE